MRIPQNPISNLAPQFVDRSYIHNRNTAILELLYIGKLSYNQIAAHFGLSSSTVKNLARSAPFPRNPNLTDPFRGRSYRNRK